MSFGSLSLFPEDDYREHRVAPKTERRYEAREHREHEYREHERNDNLRDLAGAVIVGAATIGILGMMRR
jgi:hypothetical protein